MEHLCDQPPGSRCRQLPDSVHPVFIPKTFAAYLIFLWLNTAYAVYGHLGYEIFPRTLARHWLGRWINTSVAHNTHHAKGRYNYGWYFLFWDRMMGTLDPDYDRRYQEATAGGCNDEPERLAA